MNKIWGRFIARLDAWKRKRADLALKMMIKRGVALDKEGKSQEAIAYFDDVLRADPNNSMAWSFKAGALLMLERMKASKGTDLNFVQYAGPENAKYLAQAKAIIRDIETAMKKSKARREQGQT